MLHPDRLFPIDNNSRALARALSNEVRDCPIISPHGHTDCGFLAELVAEHRITENEAVDLIQDLTYNLAKDAYRL